MLRNKHNIRIKNNDNTTGNACELLQLLCSNQTWFGPMTEGICILFSKNKPSMKVENTRWEEGEPQLWTMKINWILH